MSKSDHNKSLPGAATTGNVKLALLAQHTNTLYTGFFNYFPYRPDDIDRQNGANKVVQSNRIGE
jgi:hypothetical protein